MLYATILLACVAGALGAALAVSRSALRGTRQSLAEHSDEVQRLRSENATLTATLAAKDEAMAARLSQRILTF